MKQVGLSKSKRPSRRREKLVHDAVHRQPLSDESSPAEQNSTLDFLQGSTLFLRVLVRLSGAATRSVARNYANGVWQQYSGTDFVAHLGRACEGWSAERETLSGQVLARSKQQKNHARVESAAPPSAERPCLMCVGTSHLTSYAEWVTSFGALLAGFDVFFAPEQLSEVELKKSVEFFNVAAVVCDPHLFSVRYKNLGVPIYQLEHRTWMPADQSREPEVLSFFRQSSAVRTGGKDETRSPESPGQLLFLSIGNDGYHRKVRLSLDSFVLTAQNLLLHLQAPSWFEWRTIETVSLAHPFALTCRFAVLLKNGVLGFMNPAADWQSNLEILRPTVLALGPSELQVVASHVTEVRRRSRFRSRVAMSEGLSVARKYLEGGRSFRLSPAIFGAVSRSVRRASQVIVGKEFVAEALGDLKFIIHGLTAAQKNQVRVLDRVGIPVIETYGKTAACGLLASNTYTEPHLNLIGTPLSHVRFRLGAESVLEYALHGDGFQNQDDWVSTGDVAQMTPFGFAIVGRKLHQIVTKGGVVISPARFEWLLTDSALVSQACLVGDNMPFLSALLVLSPEFRSAYRDNPESVRTEVSALVDKVNEMLPRNGTIKKFSILENPFLEAQGELLPNGAVNRMKVLETRASDVATLYDLNAIPATMDASK